MRKTILFVITLIVILGMLLIGSVAVFADTGADPAVNGLESALQFIRPELFILIVFLYGVGLFLKLYNGFTREWTIPYILLGISFLITLAYVSIFLNEGFGPPVIVAVVIQSVLIAAVTVFGNQLIKQALIKRKIE